MNDSIASTRRPQVRRRERQARGEREQAFFAGVRRAVQREQHIEGAREQRREAVAHGDDVLAVRRERDLRGYALAAPRTRGQFFAMIARASSSG